jgi:hypothetical protein
VHLKRKLYINGSFSFLSLSPSSHMYSFYDIDSSSANCWCDSRRLQLLILLSSQFMICKGRSTMNE